MKTIAFPEAEAELNALFDWVTENHEPVGIVHDDGKAVVVVSLEDWDAMREVRSVRTKSLSCSST
jgi:PHD/YefM family antitoxin component YafN of YafNO toxin-antitoxin module